MDGGDPEYPRGYDADGHSKDVQHPRVHAPRQLVEKTSEYHLPLYVALVYFRKAFDTVEWNAVWEALYAHGVHVTLIHTLRRLYEASRTLINVNRDEVEVSVQRGVRQGDTLSPRLFVAVLRHAMDSIDWETCGLKIDGERLAHLEYADDIALVAKSRPELIVMLKKLTEASARVGLKVNAAKTTLLTSCTTTRQPIHIDGELFEFVDSASYLGTHFSLPLCPRATVNHRVRCA